jgi:hypothetical protein
MRPNTLYIFLHVYQNLLLSFSTTKKSPLLPRNKISSPRVYNQPTKKTKLLLTKFSPGAQYRLASKSSLPPINRELIAKPKQNDMGRWVS